MKTPLLAIFTLACTWQAEAAWSLTDGNSLMQGIKTLRRVEAHENLTTDELIVAFTTAGYLRGFLDSSIRWSEVEQNSLFKVPEHGITVAQFLPAIEKFLAAITDKPRALHLPVDGLLLAVLVKNFPNPALKNDITGSRAFHEGVNDNWLRPVGANIGTSFVNSWGFVILVAVLGLISVLIVCRITARPPKRRQQDQPQRLGNLFGGGQFDRQAQLLDGGQSVAC